MNNPAWLTLEEWAASIFSQPPSVRTLRTWANTKQIQPPAVMVGKVWMVRRDALYVGLMAANDDVPLSGRALAILACTK